MLKIITPLILVTALAVTLLNGDAFGSPTLLSLFLFSIITCIAGLFFFTALIFRRKTQLPPPPVFVWLFVGLAVYAVVEGLLHEFNLVHLLWAAYGLWLLLVYYWAGTVTAVWRRPPAVLIYRVVLFLAVAESLIVFLQAARLFPVPSPWFIATGTWVNPNVTAIFIAMSLFAVFRLKEAASLPRQRFFYWPVLLIMMLALMILQCRSAWLAAAVFWLAAYSQPLIAFVRRFAVFSWRGLVLLVGVLMFLQALYIVYSTKEASAQSRLRIWENSARMIAAKPLTGYGFGMFEREYNLFAASRKMPVNDHVNMAYNDFIELAFEGGIPALLLYAGFLVAWWMDCRKRAYSRMFISVIISFAVVQLTNFGFQAVPAMALLLLYAGLSPVPVRAVDPAPIRSKKKIEGAVLPAPIPVYTQWWQRSLTGLAGLLLSFLLFLQATLVTNGFYNKTLIIRSGAGAAEKLDQLYGQYFKLRSSASFYESCGDIFLGLQQPEDAIRHYRNALKRSSEPDLLAKTGYCYQLVSGYDSSRYFYQLASDLQPHRFTPKLRLMQLYAERTDTSSMLNTAVIILKMPVKVRSKKVTEIRQLAKSVIGMYDKPATSAPF